MIAGVPYSGLEAQIETLKANMRTAGLLVA